MLAGEVLLRVINSSENDGVVMLAVQSLALLCGNVKAASRLAKRGVGPAMVKALSRHKTSRELQIKVGLFVCIAGLAGHDPNMATAFMSFDCFGFTVEFIKANIGIVKSILPAVKALVGGTPAPEPIRSFSFLPTLV